MSSVIAKERAKAIGIWAAVSALGIVFGPAAGGWLLEHFWWGSVFLINVPVTVIGVIGALFLVPNSSDPSKPRLDPLGALLSTTGLIALVWAIIEAPVKGWTATPTDHRVRPRRRASGRVRHLGDALLGTDAESALLQRRSVLGVVGVGHTGLLLAVRGNVLPDAVPAVRDGLRRPRSWSADHPDRNHRPRRTSVDEAHRTSRREDPGRRRTWHRRRRDGHHVHLH